MTFQDLNLIEPILRALSAEGYTVPTPIQQQSIPYILAGRDLQGSAQTGTGKTAAFALPIIQMLSQKTVRKPGIKVLILTPTRELAIQIDESFAAYGKYTNLKHTVIFGGVSQFHQVNALQRGPDILVATPGRLIDLIGQGYINLRQLEIFVLDEADRMLDMGFINDVKRVISFLPQKRQTLFFSATMPPPIRELAKSLLMDPARVEVAPPSTTVEKIDQSIYHTNKADKPALLLHLLEEQVIQTALVFTRTKHGADRLVKHLLKHKVKSAAIHGNKSQPARQTALSSFKAGSLRVLVATDIAARGIDIDELSHVFNYDLPEVPETYVHRIGRTGRAGKVGTAIAFCAADERGDLSAIEKLIGKKIPVIPRHPFPPSASEQPEKPVLQNNYRNPSRMRNQHGNKKSFSGISR
jgi:ATP-dependent RNA helicase RhlE